MTELAIFIFEHLGGAAIVLILGVLGDYFTTPELKSAIGQWIRSKGSLDFSTKNVRRTLRHFLDGFIHRIFGKSQISIRFFVRSSLVTLLFLSIAILYQVRSYENVWDQFVSNPDALYLSVLTFGVMLFANFCIDYISNVQTIALLNMAASSGRILDTVVVFFADLALTVTLFTLVFPAALVVSAYCVEWLRPPATISIERASDRYIERLGQVDTPFLKVDSSLALFGLTIESVGNASVASRGVVSTAIVRNKEGGYSQAASEYLEVLNTQGVATKIVKQDEKQTIAEIKIGAPPLNLSVLRHLYYSAFSLSNVTRDQFLAAMTLKPITIKLRDVHDGSKNYLTQAEVWMVKCVSGSVTIVRSDGDLQGCKVNSAIPIMSAGDRFLDLRYVVVGADHFPVSPFFFTSFASSIIYYTAIFVIGFGVLVARLFGQLFSTAYLETTTKPFALLGVMLFFLVEGGIFMARLF